MYPFELLKDTLHGKDCFLVGKGPSLDNLKEDVFLEIPLMPVITISEAIHKILEFNIPNPIVSLQFAPREKAISVSRRAYNVCSIWSSHLYENAGGMFVHDNTHEQDNFPTSIVSFLRCVKDWKIRAYTLISFDVLTNGATGCAVCTKHKSRVTPETRRLEGEDVKKELEKVAHKFFTPGE